MDHALASYRDPAQSMPLSEAISLYIAEKTKEKERTVISMSQLWSITREMQTLMERF